MITLVASWAALAVWQDLRRRPAGRVRRLRPRAAAEPMRWPGSFRRVADRLPLAEPAGSRRAWSIAVLGWMVVLVLSPSLAVAGAVLASLLSFVRARAAHRRRAAGVRRALPECLEVLSLAVRAGLVPAEALRVAATVSPAPVDDILSGALDRLHRGAPWAEVVTELGRVLGPDGRSLVLLLVGEGGAPLADGLDRAAAELRDRRRREIQGRAQRLPVVVLAPLVTCILPAFVLVTIVPVVSTLGQDVVTRLPLGSTP